MSTIVVTIHKGAFSKAKEKYKVEIVKPGKIKQVKIREVKR